MSKRELTDAELLQLNSLDHEPPKDLVKDVRLGGMSCTNEIECDADMLNSKTWLLKLDRLYTVAAQKYGFLTCHSCGSFQVVQTVRCRKCGYYWKLTPEQVVEIVTDEASAPAEWGVCEKCGTDRDTSIVETGGDHSHVWLCEECEKEQT